MKHGKEFRDARDLLEGLRLAENYYSVERFKKCDWDDPDDVSLYKSQKRIARRDETILRLCPDKRCPSCGRIVLQSARWVISKDRNKVICKSCHQRLMNNKAPDSVEVFEYSIFTPERYSINPQLLVQAREMSGLSLREFARRAGWGRSYQQKIEDGTIKTVSIDVVNILICVLNDSNVTTLDSLK